ncbi:hypothetical protein S1361_06115 [Streptomyces cyanogenus]|uniref:Uncharacterized protein n=1 Tax=Streptomyces cyanogenus TaxID=80860 RepID=A0ABX7TMS4_STRCY|nr:hypothetical protein S1361_06115 [Streptomyces cyanogenus]
MLSAAAAAGEGHRSRPDRRTARGNVVAKGGRTALPAHPSAGDVLPPRSRRTSCA